MQQRLNMIDGQLKPYKILDKDLLNAVQRIKREDFVPETLKEVAYMDDDLIVDSTHYMLRPTSLMTMIQALQVKVSDRVLDIACTYGYSTLILSYLAKTVIGLEEIQRFVEKAQEQADEKSAENIQFVEGSYQTGYQKEAPFDVILVQRSWSSPPEALIEQLASEGRLVYINQREPFYGRAMLLTKHGTSISESVIAEVYAPYFHSTKTGFKF